VVRFTRRENALLGALAREPGRVLSRAELARALSSGGEVATERSVDVIVSRLRRKCASGLGWDPVRTVTGVGYALSRGPDTDPVWGPSVVLRVDVDRCCAWVHGRRVPLALGGLELLGVLAEYAGRVVPRAALSRLLRLPRGRERSRALDVRVHVLRQLLAPLAVGGLPRVETVRGVGYRLVC
jgi:DNA-binding response OmpR family regulator